MILSESESALATGSKPIHGTGSVVSTPAMWVFISATITETSESIAGRETNTVHSPHASVEVPLHTICVDTMIVWKIPSSPAPSLTINRSICPVSLFCGTHVRLASGRSG